MPTEAWDAVDAVGIARSELSRLADPEKAAHMSAYMRGRYRFYGVQKVGTTPILRRLITEFPVATQSQYEMLVSALWAEPEREAKYLALGLARRWKLGLRVGRLPMFRRMIVEGDWWDVVDAIAPHLVGGVIDREPEHAWRIVDPWVRHRNMWLRRSRIICQLGRKHRTDVERLFSACAELAPESEFFIRKAIGWALRDYARTDPEAVADFVRDHRDRLSGLSIREATKHIGPV